MPRLMRAAIGTNNVDNCSRVCHSPTSFALRKSFGLSGATGSFDDFDPADAAIIIGANPTEGHPVVGARIKQAAIRGLRLVTIDPRRIELSDYGVLHLSPRPGTNAAVMLGLAHVVHRDGFIDRAFIAARTEGFDAVEELLANYAPDAVEEITGIPAADLEAAAHVYAEAQRACILWGLGVTEHKYGSEVVRLICNLAMMTGKVGRPGSALLPLRGQNNVQGSSDMGALPDTYSDYRAVGDEAVAAGLRGALGGPAVAREGVKIPEMFDAAVAGDLKAMYIFGEDVAQTDPNTTHVVKALESLEFLVCQDIFETETTNFADVILPASSFLEKSGTFINAERRVQLVAAAIDPPGEARTDFDIITTVSRALGHDMGLAAPEDATREIAALTPNFAGVTPERLGRRGPAVAGGARRDRHADPLRGALRAARRPRLVRRPALQGARRRGRRPVPADPRHRPAPGALQRGHDDAPNRQPRPLPGRLARDPPRRRRGAVDLRGRPRLGAQPRGPHRDARAADRAHRARPRLHRVPLPRGPHEPARRRLLGRQHLVPRVQGGRGGRATGARGADRAPGRRRDRLTRVSKAPPAHMVRGVVRDGAPDEVAVEEPLEIRVDGEALAVTMRTPGHDEELALGFLITEGLLDPAGGPYSAGPTADFAANIVEVAGPLMRIPASRRFYTSSSCGVCGKGALEEVAVHAPQAMPGPVVQRSLLARLPDGLRQPAFERTGGMHATGLFSAEGELLIVREDVGRHNAMDKVVGRALLDGRLPLHGHVLCVSGRLSFELVQKAAVAGAPILVGVGAPTSLAIELASDRGMTLAAFARGDRVAVFAGEERVARA